MGNVGIKFDEMNVGNVIQKLSMIEKNSAKIWAAFDHYYKKGFFYPCIEREFGFGPGEENLKKVFDNKIKEMQTKA